MDFLRTWITGIAGAGIVGAMALAVTPRGAIQKILRMGTALLLAIAVLRPLIGFSGNFSLETAFEGYQDGSAVNPGQDLLSGIIAEQARAYIESKAEAAGLPVSVTVVCRTGDVYPEPYEVTVRAGRPEHARSALSKMIEQDFGVPLERQRYLE